MAIDNYIRIIIKDTGLSKSEILDMMNARKEDLKELISEKAAIFMLGRELCVDMPDSGASKTSFVKLTKFLDSPNTIKSSGESPNLRDEESTLVEKIIIKLKERYLNNLIAIYGIGSYFDQALPAIWMTNDIDLILIVKSPEKIPKEV